MAEGGKVKGDCIECPFHHWAFNGEGKCKSIPYSKTGNLSLIMGKKESGKIIVLRVKTGPS